MCDCCQHISALSQYDIPALPQQCTDHDPIDNYNWGREIRTATSTY